MNASDLQAAAREAYAESVTAGEPLSGVELARKYGRSPTWGLARIAEVRTHTNGAADPHPPAADELRTDSRPAAGPQETVIAMTIPQRRPWYDTAITVVVALVAAAASWGHMVHVASLAGEPIWLARAFPFTVDGLAVAALRRGDGGRRWLVLALALSVGANVLAQFPDQATQAGPIVAAIPPVTLYGCHRLLHGGRQ